MSFKYRHFLIILLVLNIACPLGNANPDVQLIPSPIECFLDVLKKTVPPQTPLSPTAIQMIQKHSGLNRLAEELNHGKGWTFILTNLDSTGELAIAKYGEGTQSQFVKKVLQIKFPEAEFKFGLTDSGKPNKSITLTIWDDAEFGTFVNLARPNDPSFKELQMAILKNGNPSVTPLSKEEIRNLMGINHFEKVVHVYKGAYRMGSEVFAKIADSLEKKPSVIFYSSAYETFETIHSLKISGIFSDVLKLSEIKPKLLSQEILLHQSYKPLLIFNDTKGYKQYLDAASNVSVIVGPVNHAESLMAGTPVISLNNPETLRSFNPLTFEAQIGALMPTGGITRISDPSELSGQLKEMLAHPPVVQAPYLIGHETGNSPLNAALDHISTYIQNALYRFKRHG